MALELERAAASVTIVGASGLPAADVLTRSSDPYCVFKVRGHRELKQKTKVVSKSLNPTWNHQIRLPRPAGLLLTFGVWDKDHLSPDDLLGRATLKLGPQTSSPTETFELDLTLLHGDEQRGTIKVRLQGVRPAFNRCASRASHEPAPTASDADDDVAEEEDGDDEPDGDDLPAPEDQLVRKDPQTWALLLLVLCLVLALCSQGTPVSCVAPEEELDFRACAGVRGWGASQLELPRFCWTPCYKAKESTVLLLMGAAALSQAMVVIISAGGFGDCLAWTYSFDLWDLLDRIEGRAESQLEEQAEDVSKNVGFFQRRAISFLKRPLNTRIERTVQKARHQVGTNAYSYSKQQLSSAMYAANGVKLCVALSWLCVGHSIVSSYSQRSVFFHCQTSPESWEDSKRVVMHSTLHVRAMACLVAALVLLTLAASIVFGAKRALHLTVSPQDHPETGRRAADRLREHFRLVEVLSGADSDSEEDEDAASGRAVTAARVRSEYVPTQQHGFPEEDFLQLKRVADLKLLGLRYKGILYSGKDLEWIFKDRVMKRVPEAADEQVTLLFSKRVSKAAKLWRKVSLNPHRAVGICAVSLASCLDFLAAQSCWTCVQGMTVSSDAAISVTKLDKQLLLLGACGSFAGIGTAAELAAVLLLLAGLQQATVLLLSEQKRRRLTALHSAQDTEHLRLKLLDFRKNSRVDLRQFERGYQEGADDEADEEEQEIKSHVWVVVDQAGKEVVQDGQRVFGGPRAIEARRLWRRSTHPRRVRLLRKPNNKRDQMSLGLMGLRDYGPPSICIEVLGDAELDKAPRRNSSATQTDEILEDTELLCRSGSRLQQMVPAEFIAGFFHVEVSLGPRRAWEGASVCLALAAVFFTCIDLGRFYVSLQGGTLSSCGDVKNEAKCVQLEQWAEMRNSMLYKGQPIDFRPSLGPVFAAASAVLSVVGVACLRVAGKVASKPGERARSCCDVAALYCAALREGATLLFRLMCWGCGSMKACCQSMPCYKKNYAFSHRDPAAPDSEAAVPLIGAGAGGARDARGEGGR